MFAGFQWGSLGLIFLVPAGLWLVRKVRPLKFLERRLRRG